MFFSFCSTPAASQTTTTLHIGLPHVPPIIYREPDGTPAGFQLSILNEIAKAEKWDLEFFDGTWDDCYKALLEGKIDILPGMTQTDDRENIFDFIDVPFYTKWTTLFIHPSEEFHTITQIRNKRIGLMEGDQNAAAFIRYISDFKFEWNPIWFETHDEAFWALQQKKVYGVICYTDGNSNFELYRHAKSTGLSIDPSPSSIAFLKGNLPEIRKTINQRLHEYKATPNSTFNRLSNKPMQPDIEESGVPIWAGLTYFLSLVALIILTVILILTRKAISKGEKALSASKNTFQTMVDNLTLGVAIFHLAFDEKGNLVDAIYVSANPQYSQIVRMPGDSLQGKSFRQIHGESRFQDWISIMDDVYIYGKPVEFELLDKKTNHWFSGRAVLFEKQKVAVLCQDVTVEKKENVKLEQSELKFRQFFEQMADGVMILRYDPEEQQFGILDSNPSIRLLLGLTGQEESDKQITSKIQSQNQYFFSNLREIVESPDKLRDQFAVEINARSFNVQVLSIHDQIISLIFVDRTEEHAKELLLTKAADTPSPFFHSPHECLIYINKHLKIEWANYQTQQYCNLTLSQLKNQPFEVILNERRTLRTDCPVQEAFQTKKIVTRDDFTLSNGHTLSMTVIPQLDKKGEIDHLLKAFVDISELRLRKGQQSQMQKMEILGRLSGGIAHDFNNILQAILGFSDILKIRFKDNPNLLKNVEAISEAGNHGAKLVKQLMGFTRREKSKPTVVDLNNQLQNLIKMLQRIIGDDVTITFLPSNQNLLFHVDPNQLDQSIINLCINARDAINHDSGIITIKTGLTRKVIKGVTRQSIFVSIADNGSGIPEDELKFIFDPFYTTKEKGKGTGLGLASVQEIVNHHNGLIELESKIGQGSTFILYFPNQDESSSLVAKQHKTPSSTSIPKINCLTVLLAEDNEKAAIFTRTILKETGCNVFTASDGQEALELFKVHQQKIDLLFFDLIMPKMSGRQAYDEIRKINPAIPIIFCSGYDQNELPQEYLDEVSALFLPKPFRSKELIQIISKMSERIKQKKGGTD
jgi:signal transduction histidine kinase/CheY-like chemotaxis protein/ABC-type amino acid transport substrate-binding protein